MPLTRRAAHIRVPWLPRNDARGRSRDRVSAAKFVELPMARPMIHLFDPAFNHVGHHVSYARSLASIALQRGYITRLIGPVGQGQFAPELVHYYELFQQSAYINLPGESRHRLEKTAYLINRRFQFELDRYPLGDIQDGDIIFFFCLPNATHAAVPLWRKILENRPRCRIVTVMVMLSGLEQVETDPDQWTRRHLFGFRQIPKDLAARIIWAGTLSEDLWNYETITGLPFQQLPVIFMGPDRFRDLTPEQLPISSSDKIRVGWMGGARIDKRIDLWAEIAREVCARETKLELVFHFGGSWEYLGYGAIRDQLLSMQNAGAPIEVLTGEMPDERYYEIQLSLDIFAMTHDPIFWRNAKSGSFGDAVYFGKPMVMHRQTSASNWLMENGEHGVFYQGDDPKIIAEALVAAAHDINRLRSNMPKVARAWRTFNGIDKLMDFVERAQPRPIHKTGAKKPAIDCYLNDCENWFPNGLMGQVVVIPAAADPFWAVRCLEAGAEKIITILPSFPDAQGNEQLETNHWAQFSDYAGPEVGRIQLHSAPFKDFQQLDWPEADIVVAGDLPFCSEDPFALLTRICRGARQQVILELEVVDPARGKDRELSLDHHPHEKGQKFFPTIDWLEHQYLIRGFIITRRDPLPLLHSKPGVVSMRIWADRKKSEISTG